MWLSIPVPSVLISSKSDTRRCCDDKPSFLFSGSSAIFSGGSTSFFSMASAFLSTSSLSDCRLAWGCDALRVDCWGLLRDRKYCLCPCAEAARGGRCCSGVWRVAVLIGTGRGPLSEVALPRVVSVMLEEFCRKKVRARLGKLHAATRAPTQ